jgi:cytochrome c1
MWSAEPALEQRKAMGLKVIIFLMLFASLLYFTKKRIWENVAH